MPHLNQIKLSPSRILILQVPCASQLPPAVLRYWVFFRFLLSLRVCGAFLTFLDPLLRRTSCVIFFTCDSPHARFVGFSAGYAVQVFSAFLFVAWVDYRCCHFISLSFSYLHFDGHASRYAHHAWNFISSATGHLQVFFSLSPALFCISQSVMFRAYGACLNHQTPFSRGARSNVFVKRRVILSFAVDAQTNI